MRRVGLRSRDAADMYFTGGACAVLQGWRETTVEELFRYPAVDGPSLRRELEAFAREAG